ncbi:hypothetical protein [Fimbriiglobus ruber]|uniref:hypothetical protein n=1 Tax=Fimbriiglobus ruber TaxID=1908690 RepID=UPI001EE6DE6A|nr:hypothetical protein [Fimbriiglobus ruber]
MTEEEWLAGEKPSPMLEFLRGKEGGRKFRLFACACTRRIWQLVIHEGSQLGVTAAERYVDGEDVGGFAKARKSASLGGKKGLGGPIFRAAALSAYACTDSSPLASAIESSRRTATATRNRKKEYRVQVALLYCIFGNPFRPVSFDPSWLTSTVTTLAQQMYDSRDFSAMPILADALQDANCCDDQVLSHCRGPGPHVRGCWCVDGCLGKN